MSGQRPMVVETLPETVLVDRRGVRWRTHQDYQDHSPRAHGWLLMVSENGEALEYDQLVQIHGFPPDDRCRRTYLIGYIE